MQNVTERLALAGAINPASYATGEQLSGAVPLSGCRRLVATIKTGALGVSATVDAQLKGAVGSGGSYAAIPGTAITQIVKASGDNVQVEIELNPQRVEDLGLGYTHVKLSIVIGTAASIVDATIQTDRSRYVDASLYDLTSVKQKVVLV
jgi:hypothetical protein